MNSIFYETMENYRSDRETYLFIHYTDEDTDEKKSFYI